jgi:putative transposase
MEEKDKMLVRQIITMHKSHPSYGYIRVAIELGVNKKRTQRVMAKYNVRPPRRIIKRLSTTKSVNQTSYKSLIKYMQINKPYEVLCSDLTYIRFKTKFVYLGTVEDIFTREIVAANISDKHNSDLALSIVNEALKKTRSKTKIFHTDQGSEFMAQKVTDFIESKEVRISVSDKGSPWQNGYKESFYSRLKAENGDLNRFETIGELSEEIYSYIKYYNTYRIHTKLKMSPIQFKQKVVESGLEKMGY